ncbi:MAG: 2-succinyl-5-enolpyruvyl-6-hydroxy-3-cyclohexene-1-carboxylic-acid synthase, partial [Muribaculaceae bacterium]|nr:2-succinyl-5-enolpyruvyl-6-hydroxy-3-cyclohexene-1-carboxylic-acid synthase [Muribaculaceae bacterium]
PLLDAFKRLDILDVKMIIDERSAAFSAIGIADISENPVALCCTSGSALLNYAPALAEAYYRRIPLLVITADRQSTRVNQGEPQTMLQPGSLSNVTVGCYEIEHNSSVIDAVTNINQALCALRVSQRPVHLNIHLTEPLSLASDEQLTQNYPLTEIIKAKPALSTSVMRQIGKRFSAPAKVLIYVGQMKPDNRLRKAIERLKQFQNIAILAEPISNLNTTNGIVYGVDAIMSTPSFTEKSELFVPDFLITIGGVPTGRRFRQFIENYKSDIFHIHISPDESIMDFYGALRQWIVADEATFMQQFASAMQIYHRQSDYASIWKSLEIPVSNRPEAVVIGQILQFTPKNFNILLSNGLTIRMANRFIPTHHRYSANRGINGIDGSTSTAIGASEAYNMSTLLITGDTSALYDLSAWCNPLRSSRMKVIVIDNGGGGIFRSIHPT